MEESLDQLDIGTLLHGILFAYQRAVKDILGTGSAIFVHPVLGIIKRINKRTGVNLIKGRNIDEVFENLSKVMPTTGLVKEFRFEKLAPKRYILHVNGCVWAPHIHNELKPKDVTCPYALIAMSIFEEVSKSKAVVIIEGKDEKAAMKSLLRWGDMLSTETMVALTREEAIKLVE